MVRFFSVWSWTQLFLACPPQQVFFFVHSHFYQWTTVWGMPGEQRAHSLCCLQVSPYCENRPHVRSSLRLFWNNRKTTGRPQFQGLFNLFIHLIRNSLLSPSCAISNGTTSVFVFLYYYYLMLNTDLLPMWDAQHYIIPWHLACRLDPEGLAALCRPRKMNKGYLEKLIQRTYT